MNRHHAEISFCVEMHVFIQIHTVICVSPALIRKQLDVINRVYLMRIKRLKYHS